MECEVCVTNIRPPQVADLASDVGRIEEGSKDAEKLLQVSPPDLLQDVS